MKFTLDELTYNAQGLIPCIAQDKTSLEVLMMAWMNKASLAQTLETGKMTYWSRSRESLWVKGETSGHVQTLVAMRYDCDKDCLLALVEQTGPACHTGRRSCFYTEIQKGQPIEVIPR